MQHSHRPTLFKRASASALLMLSAFACAMAAENAAVELGDLGDRPAVHAIWLSRNVPFTFRSERTAYTCEGFKEKVHGVLVAVGVHASLIVELRCGPVVRQSIGRRAPSNFKGEIESPAASPTFIDGTSSRISTRIALAAPAIANEQNIREATTFDAEQRLVAKMTQAELPTPSTIPIFPAVRKSIQVNGKTAPWLGADDCELLRQLSQQVLPVLGIEVTRKVICSGAKLSKPSLRVEALVPLAHAPQSGL